MKNNKHKKKSNYNQKSLKKIQPKNQNTHKKTKKNTKKKNNVTHKNKVIHIEPKEVNSKKNKIQKISEKSKILQFIKKQMIKIKNNKYVISISKKIKKIVKDNKFINNQIKPKIISFKNKLKENKTFNKIKNKTQSVKEKIKQNKMIHTITKKTKNIKNKAKEKIKNSKIITKGKEFIWNKMILFSTSLSYLYQKLVDQKIPYKLKIKLWNILHGISASWYYIHQKVQDKKIVQKSKIILWNMTNKMSASLFYLYHKGQKINIPIKIEKKAKKKTSNSKMISRSAVKTTNRTDTRKKINHKEKRRRSLHQIITVRYYCFSVFVVLGMIFLLVNLFRIQVVNNEYYQSKVVNLTEKIVYGDSAPRGRIYDRNHKLLVNNKPLKIIYYKKPSKVTTKKEIDLSYKLQTMLSLDYSKVTEKALKRFWILKNNALANKKITDEEWTLLDERKITSNDIYDKKMERITEEDLNLFTEEDKHAAYLYDLMNKGYSYDEKVIKKYDVTDEEYALISENVEELPGIGTKLDWEREYLYGDTFKTILGSVSSSESGIPSELKDDYLKKGYSLKDRVGTSYLEYQYEDLLKGNKNKYKVLGDGTYQLLEEGTRGNDITLTIDINLQREIEQILVEELIATKSEPNTDFYNRSFVIIQDAKTGEILAMAGKQIQMVNGEYKIYDYTPGILTSPVVIGSAVKGASHIVGYNTGALRIGEYRYDNCVKIAATPLKCSWTNLGYLNDITALAQSSNTYQFYTAMKVGRGNYVYDGVLKIDTSAFDTYRNTFAEFGLGVKTGIDLPKESLGYKGSDRKPGLLLDFSIGQYDNYTPIQLSQYITTIANNGNRLEPHLLKEVYNPTKDGLTSLKSISETKILNKVNTEYRYIQRVQEGFRAVMTYGTGTSYMDPSYNAAGKTGTAESFYDSDKDGVIDTPTVSNSFVAYAPYYDPKVTFTIISPDISHRLYGSTYNSTVNKRITQRVTQKYFDFYG